MTPTRRSGTARAASDSTARFPPCDSGRVGALHRHLAAQGVPGEQGAAARVGREVPALAGSPVGVEREASSSCALSSTVRACGTSPEGGQDHRVRLGQPSGGRLDEPAGELLDRRAVKHLRIQRPVHKCRFLHGPACPDQPRRSLNEADSKPTPSGRRRMRLTRASRASLPGGEEADVRFQAGTRRRRGVRDRDRRARQGRRLAPLPGRGHRGTRRPRVLRATSGGCWWTTRSPPACRRPSTSELPVSTGDVRVDAQSGVAALGAHWGLRPLLDISPEQARAGRRPGLRAAARVRRAVGARRGPSRGPAAAGGRGADGR